MNLDILNLFDEENVLGRDENISGTGLTAAELGISTTLSALQQEALYQRQATNTAANAFFSTGRRPNGTNGCVAPATTCNLTSQTFNMPNFFQGARNVRFGFRLQF